MITKKRLLLLFHYLSFSSAALLKCGQVQIPDAVSDILGFNYAEEIISPLLAVSGRSNKQSKQSSGSSGISNIEKDAVQGAFPWQVAFLKNVDTIKEAIFCGGAIISSNYVISAAHCFVEESDFSKKKLGRFRFVTGRYYMNSFSTNLTNENEQSNFADSEDILLHPDFTKPINSSNDIAIIKTHYSIIFDDFVQPICLNKNDQKLFDLDSSIYQPKSKLLISGWNNLDPKKGKKSSPNLKSATSLPLDNQSCLHRSAKKTRQMDLSGFKITSDEDLECENSMIVGIHGCVGDIGDPLVYFDFYSQSWHLAGVISWGIGCVKGKSIGVFTRMSKYVDWIESNSEMSKPLVRGVKSESDNDSTNWKLTDSQKRIQGRGKDNNSCFTINLNLKQSKKIKKGSHIILKPCTKSKFQKWFYDQKSKTIRSLAEKSPKGEYNYCINGDGKVPRISFCKNDDSVNVKFEYVDGKLFLKNGRKMLKNVKGQLVVVDGKISENEIFGVDESTEKRINEVKSKSMKRQKIEENFSNYFAIGTNVLASSIRFSGFDQDCNDKQKKLFHDCLYDNHGDSTFKVGKILSVKRGKLAYEVEFERTPIAIEGSPGSGSKERVTYKNLIPFKNLIGIDKILDICEKLKLGSKVLVFMPGIKESETLGIFNDPWFEAFIIKLPKFQKARKNDPSKNLLNDTIAIATFNPKDHKMTTFDGISCHEVQLYPDSEQLFGYFDKFRNDVEKEILEESGIQYNPFQEIEIETVNVGEAIEAFGQEKGTEPEDEPEDEPKDQPKIEKPTKKPSKQSSQQSNDQSISNPPKILVNANYDLKKILPKTNYVTFIDGSWRAIIASTPIKFQENREKSVQYIIFPYLRASFKIAKELCQKMDLTLASVKNEEEYHSEMGLGNGILQATSGQDLEYLWISNNCKVCKKSDGSKPGHNNEECAKLLVANDHEKLGKISYKTCKEKRPFVCEARSRPTAPSGPAGEIWTTRPNENLNLPNDIKNDLEQDPDYEYTSIEMDAESIISDEEKFKPNEGTLFDAVLENSNNMQNSRPKKPSKKPNKNKQNKQEEVGNNEDENREWYDNEWADATLPHMGSGDDRISEDTKIALEVTKKKE